MPLVIISTPVTYFPDMFNPPYIPGEHEVLNPATGALYPAYGLTVEDAIHRSDNLGRLWERQQRNYGSGRSIATRGKRVPV